MTIWWSFILRTIVHIIEQKRCFIILTIITFGNFRLPQFFYFYYACFAKLPKSLHSSARTSFCPQNSFNPADHATVSGKRVSFAHSASCLLERQAQRLQKCLHIRTQCHRCTYEITPARNRDAVFLIAPSKVDFGTADPSVPSSLRGGGILRIHLYKLA